MSATLQLPPDVWAHVVDVHCHPTDSLVPDSFMNSLSMKICAMSVAAMKSCGLDFDAEYH